MALMQRAHCGHQGNPGTAMTPCAKGIAQAQDVAMDQHRQIIPA
jgi:hypothetical protein